MPSEHHPIREYYDSFAQTYERRRRPALPNGYHAWIDDLEIEMVERYGRNRDVLECGCGTGLLLEKISTFAKSAHGIDLSPSMLEKARSRGLDVREAAITELPFEDHSFDVTCAFKVLPHVHAVGKALSEMARVTRPGGVVLAEFYNGFSLRALVKKLAPPGKINATTHEHAVYTRFDYPWTWSRILPPSLSIETGRGIRIVTPVGALIEMPYVGAGMRWIERRLADGSASLAGGFYIAVLRKQTLSTGSI